MNDAPGLEAPPCKEQRCVKAATDTVYADFKKYAIPYDVCAEHYAAAGAGEALTFRARDGLLLGYAPGVVAQQTEKPLRHE